jgi:hypothetical protein
MTDLANETQALKDILARVWDDANPRTEAHVGIWPKNPVHCWTLGEQDPVVSLSVAIEAMRRAVRMVESKEMLGKMVEEPPASQA